MSCRKLLRYHPFTGLFQYRHVSTIVHLQCTSELSLAAAPSPNANSPAAHSPRDQESHARPNLANIRDEAASAAVELRNALLQLAPQASQLCRDIRAEESLTGMPVGQAATRQAILDAPPFADWESVAGFSQDLIAILTNRLGLKEDIYG